jgi:hypothetical protein
MTPAEHLDTAERYLEWAQQHTLQGKQDMAAQEIGIAQTHALIARAVEAGVPHVVKAPAAS